jgi:ankyrin repeat protein
MACVCGHDRVCARLLVQYSINPATFDYAASSIFPLHLAVTSGNQLTVEVLARAGFDVHLRNGKGATAIGLAIQKSLLDIVEVLLSL